MPRKYIRKTERKYSLEQLQQAIEDVKSKNLSLGKAAIKYSVPKTTIHDQLKNKDFKEPKKGRKPIFTIEQENELANYALKCCKLFYGLTVRTLRSIAYDFAEANQLAHNFNRESRLAGIDWYYSFMSRHPNISIRSPEATSLNRITAFNEVEIKLFFDNLEQLLKKYQFSPDKIFNVNETGISNVQRNSKILAPRGMKQVGKCTSAERGSTTTVVCAFNAGGVYVPPLFIFKRKRMNGLLMKGANRNMIASVSDSGWINESLFAQWFQHFISFIKPSKESPVLLILDNHESHISLESYNICRKHGVHVLSLPPHTSHRMQPLDLTFFGPLKAAYNRECELYMASNPGVKITQFDVVELFTKAYNRTGNIEKASNSFKTAGIFPINPEKFTDLYISLVEANSALVETHTASSSSNLKSTSNETVVPKAQDLINETSASELLPIQTIPLLEQRTPPDQPIKSSITDVSIPLSNIVNLPIINTGKVKKRNTKKHSQIITSTPMKEYLEEKKRKQTVKEENKNKKLLQAKENKNNENINKKKGVRNLSKLENSSKQEYSIEYFCLVCNEKYIDPPIEDWIKCNVCNKWAHEKCTGGCSSKGYICDFCV